MYQQQRDAIANGDMRRWLTTLAPDQMEEITIMRPNGNTVTLVAARIGRTQVGVSPEVPGVRPSEIMIHIHDTVEEATACYADNVADARAQAAMLNAVAGMPPGPEQAFAAQMLLARLRGAEDDTIPVSMPSGVREVRTVPPVDDAPTGLYL